MAAAGTTVNKFADVAPELLMGVAVEVIVRGQASFLAGFLGVEDRFAQLVIGDFSLGSMASSIHEEWKHRALSGGH